MWTEPMKFIAALFLFWGVPAYAILADDRVVLVEELQKLGLQLEVESLPGPYDAPRHKITALFRPAGECYALLWLSYTVYEKKLDADFARPENTRRSTGTWAKKVRYEFTRKPALTFWISDAEVPYGCLKVNLKAKSNGRSYSGDYYLLFSVIVPAQTTPVDLPIKLDMNALTKEMPAPQLIPPKAG
jgi:hypothetical protein